MEAAMKTIISPEPRQDVLERDQALFPDHERRPWNHLRLLRQQIQGLEPGWDRFYEDE